MARAVAATGTRSYALAVPNEEGSYGTRRLLVRKPHKEVSQSSCPVAASRSDHDNEAAHTALLPHRDGRWWDGSHFAVPKSPLGHLEIGGRELPAPHTARAAGRGPRTSATIRLSRSGASAVVREPLRTTGNAVVWPPPWHHAEAA